MKKRLVIGWVFLLLLPLVGFGWLGSHWAEQEQARLDRALDELLLSKLQRWSRAIEQYFSTTHAHLELLAGPLLQAELSFQDIANHEVMGKLERHPMVRAVFLLNEKGGWSFLGRSFTQGTQIRIFDSVSNRC